MHIEEILAAEGPAFSFEFFPPKSQKASEELFKTIQELELYRPAFVSVTYGAGGSTRDLTHELVLRIQNSTSLIPVPHLTCVCHSKEEIFEILAQYAKEGISNILALRGDPPQGAPKYNRSEDDFQYAAELVEFIQQFKESGSFADPRGFGIGVAGFPEGHPETLNRIKEMDYLKAKVDAGANYICTQLFFENNDFYDFRERCEMTGIGVPIIAGIMPINSIKGMQKMADLAAGSRFPAKLLKAISRCKEDPEAVKRVGIQYATEQCADLLNNNVNGIHFYTLNKSKATQQIFASLGLKAPTTGEGATSANSNTN